MIPALKLVVLISGSGSNLQAIIDQIEAGTLNAEICTVISNKANAFGLQRAKKAGIPHHVLSHKGYPSRDTYDQALLALIAPYQPGLIVLAGFMRILTPAFVKRFEGRMMNIHPSLLPDYKGTNTHQRVIDNHETHHGVSVHFVTAELDGGPVVIQSRISIHSDDTAESLQARIHVEEHIIYPQAIAWFAADRLSVVDGHVLLDGEPHADQLIDVQE